MTNERASFDLQKEVINNTKQLSDFQLNNAYINNLAIKCKRRESNDIFELITIIYHLCGIRRKINNSVKKGYVPYCSPEDFFSLFCICVQRCVDLYLLDKGNFINYVMNYIRVMFIEERKQSFLHVTGQIQNKKYKASAVPIEEYDLASSTSFDIDNSLMMKSLIDELKKIKNGELLIYKYLSGRKPKTDKQVAENFGITIDQVRGRIKKVIKEFKINNNSFCSDYYYCNNEVFETVILDNAI